MTGQVALVTGGASGIGLALAGALARRGDTVVIADVDAEAGERAAAALHPTASAAGGRVGAVTLDVTDREAFAAVAQRVHAERGRLDLLFNNAGIAVAGTADELASAHWDRTIDVNLRGVVHGVQAVLPLMVQQGSGHVVTTASVAGLLTAPLMLPYTTTKHAVVGLSRALRVEVADLGVRVTAVCPGFVRTPLLDHVNRDLPPTLASRTLGRRLQAQPRRLSDPDELAAAVLRGIARNQALVVHPRRMWAAVGAMRVAPGLVEALGLREVRRYRRR